MSSTIAIQNRFSVLSADEHQPGSGSKRLVYGTTPGGTPRIFYSRDELLNLASSPLSQSPPANLNLPAAIRRDPPPPPPLTQRMEEQEEAPLDSSDDSAEAFQMDL